MPRNTRNVWLEANIDGRASTLEGGPVSRDGGLSATIRQRENGGISDYSIRVSTYAGLAAEIETQTYVSGQRSSASMPVLMLTTYRDRPGATVTLDVPGLTDAIGVADCTQGKDHAPGVALAFRSAEDRDAFLSLLPAWREAQEPAEVTA